MISPVAPEPGERRGPVRAALVTLLVFAGLGVLLGLAWRLLAGPAVGLGDALEKAAAPDGTYFLLTALTGLLAGGYVVTRRRRQPMALLFTLIGGLLASMIAVLLNRWTGGPQLHAWAGTLIWPWTCSLVVGLVSALRAFFTRPGGGDPGRPAG